MPSSVIRETRETTTDLRTGEVVKDSTTQVIQFPQEPPYIKMYIKDLCAVKGVSDSDQSLLRHLLVRLDYEGFVALTSRSRASISKSLDIKPKTLRNRLNRLVKANLIKNVSVNEYQVNPNYFARGNWKSICEQRKEYELKVTYSDKGRTVRGGPAEEEQQELPL